MPLPRRALFAAPLVLAPAAAQAATPPPGAAFIAVSTPDIEVAAAWWRRMFDLQTLGSGRSPDDRIGFVLLGGPLLMVELIERAGVHAAPDLPDRSYQHGLFKAGFVVDDLDAWAARLGERGAAFRHGIVKPPNGPLRTFAVADPHGNVVQLFGA